jgi:hypothetical protein
LSAIRAADNAAYTTTHFPSIASALIAANCATVTSAGVQTNITAYRTAHIKTIHAAYDSTQYATIGATVIQTHQTAIVTAKHATHKAAYHAAHWTANRTADIAPDTTTNVPAFCAAF